MNNLKWYKYLLNEEEGQTDGLEMTKDMQDFTAYNAYVYGKYFKHKIDQIGESPYQSHNKLINQFKEAFKRGYGYYQKLEEIRKDVEAYAEGEYPQEVMVWRAIVGDEDEWNAGRVYSSDAHELDRKLMSVVYKLENPNRMNEGARFLVPKDVKVTGYFEEFVSLKPEFVKEFDGFSNSFIKLEQFFDKFDRLDPEEHQAVGKLLWSNSQDGVTQAVELVLTLVP